MPRVKFQFSQVELKVGPTLTHGMMPLGRKVKRVERGTWKTLFEMLMNETKESIVIFSKGKRSKTCRGRHFSGSELRFWFYRERVPLLSKIPGDLTVGSYRVEKESYSTRRGQRVGSGFLEFRQTP